MARVLIENGATIDAIVTEQRRTPLWSAAAVCSTFSFLALDLVVL